MLGGMVTIQHVVATTRFHYCTLIKLQHNTFPFYKVQNCSISRGVLFEVYFVPLYKHLAPVTG
jgi:hypothetical protein